MEKSSTGHDILGGEFGKDYSVILSDPTFESRLKRFDQNLRLMFDQRKRKWVILEWALDNSGWNILIVCEDENKNPKPLGEWIFNKLYVWRHNAELKRSNPDQFITNLFYQADLERQKISEKLSTEHKEKLLDDRNEWRKAARELNNLPISDVTAGYGKIKPKQKGVLYAVK